MARHRHITLVGCLLLGLLGACTDVPPTPTPVATQTAGPEPTATAAATPTGAVPTAVIEPTATAPPAPVLELEWALAADDLRFSVFDAISDATVEGSTLIAVGSYDDGSGIGGAAAWLSRDDRPWQRAQRVPSWQEAAIESVTAGPAGLAAVGFREEGERVVPAVWTSANGLAWRLVTDPDLNRGQMSAVTANALGYVALGFDPETEEGLAWQSRDGLDWSAPASVPAFEVQPSVNGVFALGDTFMAYGFTGGDRSAALWSSVDGLAWEPVSGFPTGPDSSVNALTSSGTRLVAVGASYLDEGTAALAWVSDDGHEWRVSLDAGELEPSEMLAVAPLGAGFIAVGETAGADRADFRAAVWLSDDGTSWHRAEGHPSFERSRMSEILRAGPGLVALGETSDDPAVELFRPVIWLGTSR